MADKKYYWLKLKKDFFQQHHIKILKSLPNGRLYALIYLELMAESTSHDGELRYSQMLPYDTVTLASVIDEDKDILESAIDVLIKLELVEILSDGTIYMHEVNKMIGSASNSDGANRIREYRERQKMLSVTKCNNDVTKNVTNHNERIEYREKRIEKEKNKGVLVKEKKEIKQTKEINKRNKYGEYKHVLLTQEQHTHLIEDYGVELIEEYIRKIDEYVQLKGKTYKDYNLAIRNWLRNDNKVKTQEKESYYKSWEDE